MKALFKGTAFVLMAAALLSLCLTPAVFATEEPSGSRGASPSSAIETEPPEGNSLPELSRATPSGATPSGASGEEPRKPEPDTVSTGEELLQWLTDYGDTGGVVKLSDDIYLHDFVYVHGFRQPAVTIDTGEFSIIVNDGYAEFHAGSPLTIRGHGGENGVLRAAGVGMLQINGLTLEAENGYAVYQEEGAGFLIEQTSVSGDIHYAELPYVSEWEDVLVVEERGQSFDEGHLPAVLVARVIRQGQITDFREEVPVTWDLTGHEEEQEQRRRFTVSGGFLNMASSKAPVCTVAYDDFPLTFLEVEGKRITGGRGDKYKFAGDFSKPEDRLPFIIAQEYSFDGENWVLYEEKEVDYLDETFTIYLSLGAGEQEPPDIFIRLSWNDDGTMYYSNVLRFAGDNLEKCGEHGGNRGGGTDIVDPPKLPEPDPEPSEPELTLPPEPTEPETILPPEPSEPETTLPPEPTEPETNSPPEPSEPESNWPPEPTEPETNSPPEPSEPENDSPPVTSEPETAPPPEITKPETDSSPTTTEPETDSLPVTTEPETDLPPTTTELETDSPPVTSKPESDPPPVTSKPETDPPPEISEPESDSPPGPSEPESGLPPVTSSPEIGESHKIIPAAAEGTPGGTYSAKQPDALSAAAGLAAIAASIGGAVLYLHPGARKRLAGKLWNLFKR